MKGDSSKIESIFTEFDNIIPATLNDQLKDNHSKGGGDVIKYKNEPEDEEQIERNNMN